MMKLVDMSVLETDAHMSVQVQILFRVPFERGEK